MAAGDPIRGTGGVCNIGPALTQVEIKYVRDYEYTSEFATSEAGPYVNRSTVDQVPGGESGSLTVNCDVREGGDEGQDDVLAAKGTYARFVFETTGGKILTFASALVQSVTIATAANGTQTLSFTVNGVAVITQDT